MSPHPASHHQAWHIAPILSSGPRGTAGPGTHGQLLLSLLRKDHTRNTRPRGLGERCSLAARYHRVFPHESSVSSALVSQSLQRGTRRQFGTSWEPTAAPLRLGSPLEGRAPSRLGFLLALSSGPQEGNRQGEQSALRRQVPLRDDPPHALSDGPHLCHGTSTCRAGPDTQGEAHGQSTRTRCPRPTSAPLRTRQP